MILDAVVLAGGRSSRLGGSPKAELVFEGRTLLERTVDAAAAARRIVVVGDPSIPRTLRARESPEFGGPAAGIAAGLASLAAAGTASDRVLVLACDMPRIADAVPVLLAAFDPDSDGIIAVDSGGRAQYLAGVYSTAALARAVENHRDHLTNLSVRTLLDGLQLMQQTIAAAATSDIDTWADAATFGIARSPHAGNKGNAGDTMTDMTDAEREAILAEWSGELARALGLGELEVDIDRVLALAGVAARAVVRPAAPLTTFLVGYAAGRASAEGTDSVVAVEDAAQVARTLAAERRPSDPA